MNQFSTSGDRKQRVQKEKPNPSLTRNLKSTTSLGFNRNVLKKSGILISQLGFLIIMLTVFNLLATQNTSELNQAQGMAEKTLLFANTFNVGFIILLIGAVVFLTGIQTVDFSFIRKEKEMIIKKINALNFKKAF